MSRCKHTWPSPATEDPCPHCRLDALEKRVGLMGGFVEQLVQANNKAERRLDTLEAKSNNDWRALCEMQERLLKGQDLRRIIEEKYGLGRSATRAEDVRPQQLSGSSAAPTAGDTCGTGGDSFCSCGCEPRCVGSGICAACSGTGQRAKGER